MKIFKKRKTKQLIAFEKIIQKHLDEQPKHANQIKLCSVGNSLLKK
jgi:hypothetical protein